MKKILLLSFSLFLTACSSDPKKAELPQKIKDTKQLQKHIDKLEGEDKRLFKAFLDEKAMGVALGLAPEGMTIGDAIELQKLKELDAKKKKKELADFYESKTIWEYDSKFDEMRNIKTNMAQIASTNGVKFNFPYDVEGGSRLVLYFKFTPKTRETQVLLSIIKGQFNCSPKCVVSFKFDDKSITPFEFKNGGDLIYTDGHTVLNSNLMDSKKMIIEAPFYKEGRQQFKFNLSGFDKNKMLDAS